MGQRRSRTRTELVVWDVRDISGAHGPHCHYRRRTNDSSATSADFTNANVTTPGTLTSNFQEVTSQSQLQSLLGSTAFSQIHFVLPSPGGVLDLQYWDLGFTGSFTGNVTVVLHFDPSALNGINLSSLQVEHYTGGQWVIPSGQVIDPVADTITFQTNSFSPFVLSQVPEPSSVVLGLFAAVGLGVVVIRKRRQSKR